MIRFYHKTIQGKELKQLEKFQPGSWIYCEEPDEAELEFLTEKFGLNVDLLNDGLDQYEVPRLEMSDGVLYIYVRFPHKSGDKIITVPMLLALGKNFIATVCTRELPFLSRLTTRHDGFATNRMVRMLLALLNEINEDYEVFLTRISRSLRSIRIQIEDIDNKDIVRFVNFEAIINDLLAALVPMGSILQRLMHAKIIKLTDEEKEEVDDLYLSAKELEELSKTNLKAIVNIREGYSTIMTNNLNRVIKLLTSLTIVLTIPTIVGTLYGMNVTLPLAHHPYAFWIVLGLTLGVSALLLILFIKKKWL